MQGLKISVLLQIMGWGPAGDYDACVPEQDASHYTLLIMGVKADALPSD